MLALLASLLIGCAPTSRSIGSIAPDSQAVADRLLAPDGPAASHGDAQQADAKPKADRKPGADLGNACVNEIATLAAEMYAKTGQSCTAVVRLAYSSLAVLGFQLVCGKYGAVTEAQARATAQTDTGFGSSGTMLNAAFPADEYVFYVPAGDFGGSAALSARTGLSAFGGSTTWGGPGEITFPKTWRPAAALGSACPAAGGILTSRGYDLGQGQALAKAEVDKAVAVTAQTAVPAAMWHGGYVFDAVVLLYPRTVGPLVPNTAEWIVLVNGGWLE